MQIYATRIGVEEQDPSEADGERDLLGQRAVGIVRKTRIARHHSVHERQIRVDRGQDPYGRGKADPEGQT